MTVLKRHHASDMAAEEYDEIAALVREPQSKADGFVAHFPH
jgi:hypothetical protein